MNSKFRIQNSELGFTMIELMVTVGIFAMMTGLVLANFRSGERSDAVRVAAESLAQDLHRAQGMVLSGQVSTYKDAGDPATIEQFPQGGYGIAVDTAYPEAYTLFIMGKSGNPIVSPSTPLPKGVRIQAIGLDGAPAAQLLVTFRPPDAHAVLQTIANGFALDAQTVTMTLGYAGTSQTRRVTINRVSGKISVE
ncbi:prepilin-type N-terminal cleavage/methylation domain-containing protein [Candidatus Uhrbacteria bacterium]|nr:prepilin-type N-terminal cleavage/methylation domain-containing protein [Candidatus Uhrbacteria bacterium]